MSFSATRGVIRDAVGKTRLGRRTKCLGISLYDSLKRGDKGGGLATTSPLPLKREFEESPSWEGLRGG